MIYIPKYYKPQELLDQQTYERFGAEGLRYVRQPMLIALDWIHENYPKLDNNVARTVLVNNWHTGGQFHWRGLRLPGCPEYKPHSAHSWGAGFDVTPSGITCEAFRKWLVDFQAQVVREGHLDHPIMAIRRIEIGTPTWAHLDGLEHSGAGILMVNP